MVTSPNLEISETDIWIKASWEEFIKIANSSAYTDGRFYYDKGIMALSIMS